MRAMTRLTVATAMILAATNLAPAQAAKKPANAAADKAAAASAPAVTVDMLMKLSPRANKQYVEAIVAQWPAATAAGITTPNRIHHFLAELMTESGGVRFMEENLNYSAKRLRQIFPKYVRSDEDAMTLAGKPSAIANRVYANRLGNVCPTDGWDYRGSGLIQLTGRANFRSRDASLKLNPKLEEHPALARSFPTAFHVAVSYWTSRNINAPADKDDLVEVRRRVNGGKIGLKEAGIWLTQARRAVRLPGQDKSAGEEKSFGDPTSAEQIAVEDQLVALGFLPPQDKSSRSDKSAQDKAATVSNSLRAFQASRDIPQTGQFDEATLYELTDPGNFAEQLVLRSKETKSAKGALPAFCRKPSEGTT